MIPKSEIDEKLLPSKNDHAFWFKLGRETCNLDSWCFYCFLIIQENYCKSDPRAKSLLALGDTFFDIKGVLDDFLLSSYRKGSKEEQEFMAALHEYVQPFGKNCLYITEVFYNIGNIEKPVKRTRDFGYFDEFRMRMPVKPDFEYIEEFRLRMDEYIRYLKFIQASNTLPAKKEMLKQFDKAVKKIDRAQMHFSKKFVTTCNTL